MMPMFVTTLFMSACKKNDADGSPDKGPIKVKYEITSTLPFSIDPDDILLSSIAHTNATYNVEVVSELSGKHWSKEFLIQDVKKDYPIAVYGTVVLKGTSGNVNTKIYINGVLKSESNQGVQKITEEISTALVNATYTF